MGWCSGTELFDEIMGIILKEKVNKKKAIKSIINSFEDMDWDCQGDSAYYDHPLVEKCFKELHPDWFEEGDEEWT